MNIKINDFVKKEPFLIFFSFLLLIFYLLNPSEITNYPQYIDWNTIAILTTLLIIITGLKTSNYLEIGANRIISRFKTERNLAISLIILSTLLSTFLTNDISLFIIVPITLSFQSLLKNDISKLIILEAIAVNVGSSLTPIGNPQNIYLWQRWNIPFHEFIFKLFPLFIITFLILIIFTLLLFPSKKLNIKILSNYPRGDKILFISSSLFLIIYIILLQMNISIFPLIPLFFIYLFSFPKSFLKTDWLLILMFMIIFIDMHLISELSIVKHSIIFINTHSNESIFLFSSIISQIIGNVPAAIFVSKFSDNWLAIVYGVNIGGNGLIIGSFANLIALRIAKNKRLIKTFHKYSIPFFVLSFGIFYLIFLIFFK